MSGSKWLIGSAGATAKWKGLELVDGIRRKWMRAEQWSL